MIIVRLKGGLGNQLFQYALGRSLSIKNKDILKIDISCLAGAEMVGNIHREYGLVKFKINATIADQEEILAVKPILSPVSVLMTKIRNKLFGDRTVCFDPIFLAQTGDVYLDGYWQSPRYFEAIREILLQELTLALPQSGEPAELAHRITSCHSVSLHVRRGDYIKNPRVTKEFGVCSTAYYTKAITTIRDKISNPTFFIFSDNITWVKENLPLSEDTVFVEGKGLTDSDELVLMSQCQHNIIANSSFSWWGAWLNQNPNKIVIAPYPWFNTAVYDKNLISPSWLQLAK